MWTRQDLHNSLTFLIIISQYTLQNYSPKVKQTIPARYLSIMCSNEMTLGRHSSPPLTNELSLHTGQRTKPWLRSLSAQGDLHRMWEHGRITGCVNSSKQIGHINSSTTASIMGYNDNIKVAKHGNCKVNGQDSQKYRLLCFWWS